MSAAYQWHTKGMCQPLHSQHTSMPKPAPLDARVDGRDGRQRVQAQLQVKRAPAQVVHDADLIPPRAQVQRGRPAAVPVPAYELSVCQPGTQPCAVAALARAEAQRGC